MKKSTKTILVVAVAAVAIYFLTKKPTVIVKASAPASSGEDKEEAANFDGKGQLKSRTGW